MSGAKPDLLDIVEAAYDLDSPGQPWLARLTDAVRPHLDRGFGVAGFEFHRPEGGMPTIVQRHNIGIPDALEALYPTVFTTMDPAIRQRPFLMGPCVTGSQLMGMHREFRDQPHMKRYVQQFGMFDSIWITAAEPSGLGCGFHAGRPKIAWASPAEMERWGRIAAHLSAAVRLRTRLKGAAKEESVAGEATLDPAGKVHEASGPASTRSARELLRRAVVTLEKARGAIRATKPDEALGKWKALVGGRWSLVDHIEENGRRYIVARQNDPVAPGPDSLTAREKQVIGYARLGHHNKLIAYDLGIADSTVRVLLARAAAKLGVRSRDEVIRALQPKPTDP
jgi:DNA-binding CsgD family transcriptional regulator